MPKTSKDDPKQTPEKAEDELHVRIKKLNPGSLEPSDKLYEMSAIQRKKLEQALKERLENVGWGTGGILFYFFLINAYLQLKCQAYISLKN